MSECGSCKLSLACSCLGWTNGQVLEATNGASAYPAKYPDHVIAASTCDDCGSMYLVLRRVPAPGVYEYEANWLSWQQIDMMFDCPIFAMQATLEGIGITTWDCPQCKRWRKPSEFERRRNERYEQEKQKKEKGALSQ